MSEKILKRNIKGGEVYWGRLDDAEGYEQQNERPLVIVSNNKQNEIEKLLVVIPLSLSLEKIYPFQVAAFFLALEDYIERKNKLIIPNSFRE